MARWIQWRDHPDDPELVQRWESRDEGETWRLLSTHDRDGLQIAADLILDVSPLTPGEIARGQELAREHGWGTSNG